jgi:hypothetical protein
MAVAFLLPKREIMIKPLQLIPMENFSGKNSDFIAYFPNLFLSFHTVWRCTETHSRRYRACEGARELG